MERLVSMKREPIPAKMEMSRSTQETRASQPKIQLNPRNDHSEESIPIEERKWKDILAKRNFKGNTFESAVSELVTKFGAPP